MLSKGQSTDLLKIIDLCNQALTDGASPFGYYGRIKNLAECIQMEQ